MKTIKKTNSMHGAYALALLLLGGLTPSCTKLEERMHSEMDHGNPDNLLVSAYTSLNGLQSHWVWRTINPTTDETLIPSRGGAWLDFAYQSLHMHEYNPDNWMINNAFNELNSGLFAASDVLRMPDAAAQTLAEARFIRALLMYTVLSHWGFAVHRENMNDVAVPPIVLQPKEALEFIRQELAAAIPDLPAFKKEEAWTASREAAKALLMKLHLNWGAFLNRENPTFAKADMDKVLALAAEVRAGAPSLKLSEGKAYYDSFAPLNDQISDENIFTLYNQPGDRQGRVDLQILFPFFKEMKPEGYGGNGWVTTGKFYRMFEKGDIRRGTDYNGYDGDGVANPGKRVNVGFLAGQQYDMDTDTALIESNSGLPLLFTVDVPLHTDKKDKYFRQRGIRVNKYPYDFKGSLNQMRNDFVIFRYADLRLMEAEAILRGGTGSSETALSIVNEIRQKRGASTLTGLSLNDPEQFATADEVDDEGNTVSVRISTSHANLISERGRELYWEGWRREDIVRFGTFREPGDVKVKESPAHTLVLPVPTGQLSVSPNLKQNPGY